MKPRAVVLLSGGLDSAVTLYDAIQKGFECHCLLFDYGQRHKKEIAQARKIAARAQSACEVVRLGFSWKGSSLVDGNIDIPANRSAKTIKTGGIPNTYVPCRNTIFLSIAASCAEAIGAEAVFIGAHIQDSSGYPDCRKEYLAAIDRTIRAGTKAGLEDRLRIYYPLIDKTKTEIIRLGKRLAVPFELTWSCYRGGSSPCGTCDSCVLRAKGFQEAGIDDPLLSLEV